MSNNYKNIPNPLDIFTQEVFLDEEGILFVNKFWNTSKVPDYKLWEKLNAELNKDKPEKYFNVYKFKFRFWGNKIIAMVPADPETLAWLSQTTLYYKKLNKFFWIKNPERISSYRAWLSWEEDWVASDYPLARDIQGDWWFATKPLTIKEIGSIKSHVFCPPEREDVSYKILEANEFKVEGNYILWGIRTDDKNHGMKYSKVNSTIWFRGERISSENWDFDSLFQKKKLAGYYLLPDKEKVRKESKQEDTFKENIIEEKKTTQHFLEQHCHYSVEILGEELGKLLGISDKTQWYTTTIQNEVNVSWELIVGVASHIHQEHFKKTFLIKQGIDEKTTGWFKTIGDTIMAGANIAQAYLTKKPAHMLRAGASTIKAIGSWNETLNDKPNPVLVSEIEEFWIKLSEHLVNIIPKKPLWYEWSYQNRINHLIAHDWFPFEKDSELLWITRENSNGNSVLGKLHGWVKLNDKSFELSNNRWIEYIKSNEVFIYQEQSPTKEYLKRTSTDYSPDYVNIGGGKVDWVDRIPEVLKREKTYAYCYIYTDNYSFSLGTQSNGMTISYDGVPSGVGYSNNVRNGSIPSEAIGKGYQKLSYSSSSGYLEWGREANVKYVVCGYLEDVREEERVIEKDSSIPYDEQYFRCNSKSVELVKEARPSINIPSNEIIDNILPPPYIPSSQPDYVGGNPPSGGVGIPEGALPIPPTVIGGIPDIAIPTDRIPEAPKKDKVNIPMDITIPENELLNKQRERQRNEFNNIGENLGLGEGIGEGLGQQQGVNENPEGQKLKQKTKQGEKVGN